MEFSYIVCVIRQLYHNAFPDSKQNIEVKTKENRVRSRIFQGIGDGLNLGVAESMVSLFLLYYSQTFVQFELF